MPKTAKPKRIKEPSADFPLFVHDAKHPERARWAKKVCGKFAYFGKTATDPKGVKALEEWLRVKDDLLARRKPRSKTGELTLVELVNQFLTHKQARVDSGELGQLAFVDYQVVCGLVLSVLGTNRPVSDLRPLDFEGLRGVMASRWGPNRLANQIVFCRSIFKFGFESGLFETPVRFGPGFVKPSAKSIRAIRTAKGDRTFTAEQLRAILGQATVNTRAMILLGINCGFGNSDCGLLTIAAVDLAGGWLTYPRRKTAIPRRCPLWPETVEAIKAVLADRPTPKPEASALLFLRVDGSPYTAGGRCGNVAKHFDVAAKAADVIGRSFYDLRRTFQTIGEGAHDLVAVRAIMGHAAASGDMSAVYRQRVEDSRLQAVTDYVRNWLFGTVLTPRA